MCGICGILAPKVTDHDHVVVHNMMDKLRHRGPDGEGFVSNNSMAMGHRRLSVIDLEHGKQPMQSHDGRYSLTYNGEIYNYKELRQDLSAQGVEFKTNSDTEVLLNALIIYGNKVFNKLIGMYAFVFYDAQSGKALLARDEMGIKPLYYYFNDGRLIFASEIKALLADSTIQAQANETGLQQYFVFQFCLKDHTLFKDIKKLKPGCYVEINTHQINEPNQIRHWNCNFTINEEDTESDFIGNLDELINDSINLQLRSDVPLGTYLSGGIDSSLITALAAKKLESPVKSFHGRFAEGSDYDESAYAKMVTENSTAEYVEIVPTQDEFIQDLPKLIYHMDEPAAGPGLFPQYKVSQLASQHVKVILGGQGGDEIFAGYARYVVGYLEQALKGSIMDTQEEGKHLVTLSSIVPNLQVLKQYVPMMRQFWSKGLFEDMDARYFHLIDRSPDAAKLIKSDIMRPRVREEIFRDFQEEFNNADTSSYINKMTHFDLRHLLPALLQLEDRVSMSVSLESRVPLIDRRIVDLVTTMPPALKFAGGKTKHILKEISRQYIPEQVVNRTDKMGFPVPLREWMQQGSRTREFVSDILLSERCRQRGLFNQDELVKIISNESQFGRQLWGALCLELWHQIFIDKTLTP